MGFRFRARMNRIMGNQMENIGETNPTYLLQIVKPLTPNEHFYPLSASI